MVITGGGLRIDYLITQTGKAHSGLVGGNAIYAAVGAALWLDDVAIWGRIGENYPTNWLQTIATLGLNIHGVRSLSGLHEHRTFFAYLPDGQRIDTDPKVHYDRIGADLPAELHGYVHSTPGQEDLEYTDPLALRLEDWSPSFQQVSGVHLSPLPLRSHLDLLVGLKQKNIPFITVDPGERYMVPELTSYIREIASRADAFLPSEQEVRSLFGLNEDIQTIARIIGGWGIPLVIIKRGANGVLFYDAEKDSMYTFRPWHAVNTRKIVDVTGAGDAFCGGFIAGLVISSDPIEAVKMGLISASIVIEGYGADYALKVSKRIATRRLSSLPKPKRCA